MKKFYSFIITGAMAASSVFAQDENSLTKFVVGLNNGSSTEFNLDEVEEVSFRRVAGESTPLEQYFRNLPQYQTPQETGRRLGFRYVSEDHQYKTLNNNKYIDYPETFLWIGTARFAAAAHEEMLLKNVVDRWNFLLTDPGEKTRLSLKDHVDRNMFGALAFEMYQITGNTKYRDMGVEYADAQWELPDDANDDQKFWHNLGLSWQTRIWIDDMYMIPVLQTAAYKATGDRKYIDRCATQMAHYIEVLQEPNGLYYHGSDAPFFWGRGNGWMAAGMTEFLKVCPADHPKRAVVLEAYKKMMATLLSYQISSNDASKNGLWYNLVDRPESDSFRETSGSAMFIYAFINGVKYGWLDADTYGPAAVKGWKGLIACTNHRNMLRYAVKGTNKSSTIDVYKNSGNIQLGNWHGHLAYMWCCAALVEEN